MSIPKPAPPTWPACAPTRTWSRRPCRYGLSPLVVPQLKTITLGGAVTGLGIESASFRNGMPHESVLEMDILTGAGELLTVSPERHTDLLPSFPEFLWNAGIFDQTTNRAGARRAVCDTAARPLPFPARSDRGGRTHHRHRRTGRNTGRLPRRGGVQRRRKLPVRGPTDHHRPGQRLHRTQHLLPIHPARRPRCGSHQGRPADRARLLALGHRLVLVLARPACRIRGCDAGGRAATGAAASTRS